MFHRSISLSIAIPAYNECQSLFGVVSCAIRAAGKITKNFEILIVDDGSTDGTGKIADNLAKNNHHVFVIHHPKNLGFSGAIKTCYKKSKKDYIVLLPADGQIDPNDLSLFLAPIDHADVVVGYRITNPEPFYRRFNSKVFHIIFRLLYGVRLREISTSILWRKTVIQNILITATPRSALIEPEVISKAWQKGYRFAQIPVPYYPRSGGSPKGANILMMFETFKELLRLWWDMRIRKTV